MSEYSHAIIIILVMGIATFATRTIPVLVLGRGKSVPDYVLYLGRVIPYTAMGLLIVYCLRNVPVLESPHGLPELIALSIVTARELAKTEQLVHEIDPEAFIIVSRVSEVKGRGFTEQKKYL